MANDSDPDFPGFKVPKGKPASATAPTIVPKSYGTGGTPIVAPNDPDFPGFKVPKGKSGGEAAAPPPESQNSLLYDMFNPQPADLNRPQTWRDWATKTYSPTIAQGGRAALDDFSFGTADWARSKLTGENLADLRTQTANAQAALGPMGPVINAATYMAPGLGEGKLAMAVPGRVISKGVQELAPTIGRYGAAATEGGVASGLSSTGHQAGADQFDIDKVIQDTGKGMLFGLAAQSLGDITSPAVQRVANYVTGKPGAAGEAWNWRTRAGMDDPTLPGDVANQQVFRAPNDPAQPGLAKLQSALAQSTDPGVVADASTAALGWGVNYSLGGADNPVANWISASGPAIMSRLSVNPAARTINTYDRSLNVGHALDQLYPTLYGKPATTPVGGWADALRDLTVGGQRPTTTDPRATNAQWW